jgi:hypothetical protein
MDEIIKEIYVYLKQSVRINTGAYGMELPDIFLLSIYIFIFNKISLIISSIFPLHNVFVSIYPYKHFRYIFFKTASWVRNTWNNIW